MHNRSILNIVCCLSFFFFSGWNLHAEDTEKTSPIGAMLAMSLEELVDFEVVSATGVAKPRNRVPAVASVITSADIKRLGATTLDEALESVPGLHVVPSSKWFTSIWSIRGVHTSTNPQVLMLLNGVPLTSNYSGTRGLSFQMPTAMISKIEVIRGPGSAVYGADAFAGVINVITKDNSDMDGAEVGARYGSFNTYDAWIQHGGRYKGWDIWGGIETQKTDGDHNRIVEKDYLHAVGAAALSNAPGYLDTRSELVDAHFGMRKDDFTLHLFGNIREQGNGGPGASQALTYGSDFDSQKFLADLTYVNDRLHAHWTFSTQLYYSYMYDDSLVQYFPIDFRNMFGEPIYQSEDGGGEVIGIYKGSRNHTVRLGTGLRFFDFAADQYKNFGPAAGADQFGKMVHVTDPDEIYISNANRTLWYALLQDEWGFSKKWELTAGLRYDKYSDFGSTINPRMALVWESRYDLTTKLLYGQAFRAPSFSEQYIKNNPQAIGSDDLSAEEIKTLELAFDYQPTANLRTSLNFFMYKAEKIIEYIGFSHEVAPGVATNHGEQDGHGVEIDLVWQAMENLLVRSNFAYQRSKNKQTGSLVHDAPEMQLYLNPHWIFLPDWSLDCHVYWIAGRHREPGDPRPDIDDYALINLTLRRINIARHWEMAMAVKNLLDEIAREPSPYDPAAPEGAYMPNDYPLESRAIWGELRYNF
jgi:iron complex outermembrane receptor protein